MKRDWTNITLKDWYEIKNIMSLEDEYTVYNLIDYLYDIDSTNIPISELKKYDISFLKEEPNITPKDEYEINGDIYYANLNLTEVTAAQFIDYQNYIKEKELRFEKLLSVFIFPKGHKYNDGYDMKKVQKDLLELPFAVANKIGFFFKTQFKTFVHLTLYYLEKEIQKTTTNKETKKKLRKNFQNLQSLLSELSHIF